MKTMEYALAVILKIDRSSNLNRCCGIEARCPFPVEVLRRACAFLTQRNAWAAAILRIQWRELGNQWSDS